MTSQQSLVNACSNSYTNLIKNTVREHLDEYIGRNRCFCNCFAIRLPQRFASDSDEEMATAAEKQPRTSAEKRTPLLERHNNADKLTDGIKSASALPKPPAPPKRPTSFGDTSKRFESYDGDDDNDAEPTPKKRCLEKHSRAQLSEVQIEHGHAVSSGDESLPPNSLPNLPEPPLLEADSVRSPETLVMPSIEHVELSSVNDSVMNMSIENTVEPSWMTSTPTSVTQQQPTGIHCNCFCHHHHHFRL